MATNHEGFTTRDPICGMTVNEKTALQATRDGETYYFCCEDCREKFLSEPAGAKSTSKSDGWNG